MTSALERLNQIRKQEEKEANDRMIAANQKRLVQEALEKQRALDEQRAEQERIKHVKSVTEPILRKTKIVEQLEQLERSERSRFRRHAVIVQHTESASHVLLLWGEKFKIKSLGEKGSIVDYEKGLFEEYGRMDYKYMTISIDPIKGIIYSGSSRLDEYTRQVRPNNNEYDPQAVSEFLLQEFLSSPQSVFRIDGPPPPDYKFAGP